MRSDEASGGQRAVPFGIPGGEKASFDWPFFYEIGRRVFLVPLALFFGGKYGKGRTSFFVGESWNIFLVILMYCAVILLWKRAVGKKGLTEMRNFPR